MSSSFVLTATPDGAIRERVLDGLGLVEGNTLYEVTPPSAHAKVGRLLQAVVEQRAVASWELPVLTTDGVGLVQVGGCLVDEQQLTIIGQGQTADVFDLYDEMMRINNEQATALRATLKRIARLERGPSHAPEAYDELTRLTNELGVAQRNLAKKNRKLRELDQRKNQLLGMVAHDLRNPLGVVVQFSRMLSKRSGDLGTTGSKLVQRIEANSHFMLALVEDLLDLSAVESGEIRLDRQALKVTDWVADAVEHTGPLAADKGSHVKLDLEPDLAVDADRRRVGQVLSNFMSNAVKYSPSGATTVVRARRSGDVVRVEVVDQGPGIPADERDRLFRPFGVTSVRSTAGEKSTGLGLAIAKKVIEAHDGRIGVDSEPGEGSTFWCELPAAAAT